MVDLSKTCIFDSWTAMRSSCRNAGKNEAWMDMIVASMFNDRDEPVVL